MKKEATPVQRGGRISELESTLATLNPRSREHANLSREKGELEYKLKEILKQLKKALSCKLPDDYGIHLRNIDHAWMVITRDRLFLQNNYDNLQKQLDQEPEKSEKWYELRIAIKNTEKQIDEQELQFIEKKKIISYWQNQVDVIKLAHDNRLHGLFEQVEYITGTTPDEVLRQFELEEGLTKQMSALEGEKQQELGKIAKEIENRHNSKLQNIKQKLMKLWYN